MKEQNADTISYLFKIPNDISELAMTSVNSQWAHMWAAECDPRTPKYSQLCSC